MDKIKRQQIPLLIKYTKIDQTISIINLWINLKMSWTRLMRRILRSSGKLSRKALLRLKAHKISKK
jgi:hypothetical protein